MAAQFTADLNPKSTNKMDVIDLMKMDDYLGRTKVKPAVKTATPGADAVLAKADMLKSDAADKGVPFKFGNNYQSEE